MKRIGFWLVFSGMMLALSGCGYHVGFLGHPQLKTIAVAPAVNETALYNTASDMRMMLCEAVTQDGSLKLVDQSTADCILYCTVKEAAFADVTTGGYNSKLVYTTKEWSARVTVEYHLIIPGQAKPLKQGIVTGNARFMAPIDEEVSRLRAVRQACYEASRSILYAIVEGW